MREGANMQFRILDVFAETKYSGNQLGVFLCETALPEETMQRMARELNFSESVFLLSREESDAPVGIRIFTPAHEVDFAGHPSLGAAFAAYNYLLKDRPDTVRLLTKAGIIPVEMPKEEGGPLWMRQIPPVFGEEFATSELADILSIDADAILGKYPVQDVSTGLPHIIIPVATLGALRAAKVNKEKYFRFIEHAHAKNLLLFCLEARSGTHGVSVRMFADYLGIPEDPATGSGNGCLAGYLVKHRIMNSRKIECVVGQGHEIGRPSLLFLKAEERDDGAIDIMVGGRVFEIASGEWMV